MPKKIKKPRLRYRNNDFLFAIGERVRSIRLSKNYSIDRLYLETEGLSRATVSRIEKGQTDAQISTLKRIAETLGVTLPELVKI